MTERIDNRVFSRLVAFSEADFELISDFNRVSDIEYIHDGDEFDFKFTLNKFIFVLKVLILFTVIIQISVALSAKEKYTNSLINEESPYLQQHANNPVNWYAWNKKTFKKALGALYKQKLVRLEKNGVYLV